MRSLGYLHRVWVTLAAGAATLAGAPDAPAQKIRQYVTVKNARENFLETKALVVGLAGTGDSPKGATVEFIKRYFQNRGDYTLETRDITSKNIAIVSVTAVLPPFAREGTHLDVQVAALGDAKALKGGRLLMAMLTGPRGDNPKVYAVAAGELVQGGADAHPTTALVPRGAIVEKAAELNHQWIEGGDRITLYLNQPDFQLAHIVSDRLRGEPETSFGFRSRDEAVEFGFAQAVDAGSIVLRLPPRYQAEPVSFLAKVLETDLGESVTTWAEPTVYVNTHTGEYALTGEVWISAGSVGIRNNVNLNIRDTMRMQEWLRVVLAAQPAPAPGAAAVGGAAGPGTPLTSRDVVELIIALDGAGMLRGKLVVTK